MIELIRKLSQVVANPLTHRDCDILALGSIISGHDSNFQTGSYWTWAEGSSSQYWEEEKEIHWKMETWRRGSMTGHEDKIPFQLIQFLQLRFREFLHWLRNRQSRLDPFSSRALEKKLNSWVMSYYMPNVPFNKFFLNSLIHSPQKRSRLLIKDLYLKYFAY